MTFMDIGSGIVHGILGQVRRVDVDEVTVDLLDHGFFVGVLGLCRGVGDHEDGVVFFGCSQSMRETPPGMDIQGARDVVWARAGGRFCSPQLSKASIGVNSLALELRNFVLGVLGGGVGDVAEEFS